MLGLLEILCAFVTFFFVLYYYYKIKFNFWSKRGVPGPEPILFFGNKKDVILRRTSLKDFRKELYDKYRNEPLVGFFDQTMPILLVNDSELIKDVLIAHSAVFTGRGIPYFKKGEPMSYNIFNMKTVEVQPIRTKASPIFTPSKIRRMVPFMLERSEVFKDWLDMLLSRNERINYSEVISKYVADLSSTCLFGYDLETFKDGENKALQQIKRIQNANSWRNVFKTLLPNKVIYKKLYDLIGYYMFDNEENTKIFTALIKEIDNYRKKYGIDRSHDLTDALMGLKQNNITEQLVVTSFFSFFIASFESSAATITNTLYELAINQLIQDKLREEIKSVRANNNRKETKEITYEDINTMSYLDGIFKETLRKYPIADLIERQTSSSYTFRNFNVTVPKNQVVGISVLGIHYNPDIYPNPDIYDPERFIGPEVKSRNPMHYIPFGFGPRNCIGERFGTLQVKIALITIIDSYKVEPYKDTKLIFSEEIFIQRTKNMYLKLTKID